MKRPAETICGGWAGLEYLLIDSGNHGNPSLSGAKGKIIGARYPQKARPSEYIPSKETAAAECLANARVILGEGGDTS